MGSVGKSAEAGRNTLCTWFNARKWIDNRFESLRLQMRVALAKDPVALACFLRRMNLAWFRSCYRLKQELLPQRGSRGQYNRVRTVNPLRKSRPRNSRKLKLEVGLRADRRGRTGLLKSARGKPHVATGKPRGRPPLPKELRDRRRARSARKKAHKRRLKNPPKRHYPENRKSKNQPQSKAKKREASGVLAARSRVDWKKSKDKRKNHDPRYGYQPPTSRMRAKDGKHSRPGIRKGKTPGNPGAALLLVARSIRKAQTKRARLRAYWAKVRGSVRR